ncbi:hypothetical protein ACHAPT_000167 [Fusarium lateritium]
MTPGQVTLPSECPYQKTRDHPVLRGCVNNDSCPSWFWNVFGQAENSSQDVHDSGEELASTKYAAYRKAFAESYFARRSPPIRKNFGHFLAVALEDIVDSDTDDGSDEISVMDEDEGEWSTFEDGSLGDLSSLQESSSVLCSTVAFDVNPGLLPQDDASSKKDNSAPESESRPAENLAKEYRDLVKPIWTWFFPPNSGRNAEVVH